MAIPDPVFVIDTKTRTDLIHIGEIKNIFMPEKAKPMLLTR